MSEDRKYRQRGYQDDRDRDRPKPPAPRGPREERDGPRTPNLMGSHEVFRCGRCARIQTAAVGLEDRCPQCGVDLHSCVQCVSFDPGSTFECMQAIAAPPDSAAVDRTALTTAGQARFIAPTTIARE